jgi:hypothetical protein
VIAPRKRAEGCLSELQLDQLAASELAPDDETAARRHLEACTSCTARQAAIARVRDAFRAALPERTFVAHAIAARSRPRRHWWQLGGAVVAAAAAIVVVVVTRPRGAGDDTRVKGGERVGFYIERDGVVNAGVDGDVVHPGDRVRFTITTRAPAYVAIASLDDEGRSFVYYPETASANEIPAGTDLPMSDAIELDDTLGRERVFAFFCDRAVDSTAVRAALAAKGPALAGCRSANVTWRKEPRR